MEVLAVEEQLRTPTAIYYIVTFLIILFVTFGFFCQLSNMYVHVMEDFPVNTIFSQ